MINKSIKIITCFLYDNKIIEEKYIAVYEYGLELLLTSILEMLAVIIISIIAGKLLITTLFLLSFCILRIYAGGFHASTNLRCFLVLIIVYTLFLLVLQFAINTNSVLISIPLSLISELFVIWLAPVDNENKPLSDEIRKRNRRLSIIIVTIETLIVFTFIITMKNNYLFIGISYGQLAAALSIVAVKIINFKRGHKNEIVENNGG
jgi:accessory gene regulator B